MADSRTEVLPLSAWANYTGLENRKLVPLSQRT
jgi:hypothetical protein